MKVSFLVTYYNQEKFISQSLDSILKIKKTFDWEILIGDDGSSDNSIETIKKYISMFPENIKLYVMTREPGIKYQTVKRSSANRLNLLSHASGEYFCILDGDDWYCDDEFVTQAINVMRDNKNISIVAFGYQLIHPDLSVSSKSDFPTGIINTREYLTKMYTPAGACVHLTPTKQRLTKLNRIGFFDDNDIIVNSLNIGEMYAIKKIIYNYRQSENSTYNSMNMMEQNILNTQGLDVDLKYIDTCHNELYIRNASNILGLFFNKSKIELFLSKENIDIYNSVNSCIPNSITYIIMNWENAKKYEKRQIWHIIRIIMYHKPHLFVNALCNCLLNK